MLKKGCLLLMTHLVYDDEVHHQLRRLESIGLFEKLNFEINKCPFCLSTVESHLPGVAAMKASIRNLDESLGTISRERPRVQQYIKTHEAEAECIRNRKMDVEESIQATYDSEERLRNIRDLNIRRALVLGRISLWTESVEHEENYSEYNDKIKTLSDRIKELDDLLDRENTLERVQSALSYMQTDMTAWAKELELEGHGNPYRIDLSRATVVMDKDRPIALQQMGSGSNWVGVHVIAMFALHKFFIEHSRPVYAKGRSMIQRGIFDGDLLVVRKQSVANVGQTIIARVNGEDATAKVYALKDGRPYLKAANNELDAHGKRIYRDIYPKGEWDILGIVDYVIHAPKQNEF